MKNSSRFGSGRPEITHHRHHRSGAPVAAVQPEPSAPALRVHAAAKPVAVAAHCCWLQTPRDSRWRDLTCSVAGTPRCDSRRESGRCTDATHRGCRPSAVPMFPDILPQAPRRLRHRDRQSPTQGSGQCAAFAFQILSFRSMLKARGSSARRQLHSLQMNAANERSRGQLNVKPLSSEAGTYSTLPIFFTAAIRRALSSATNFENSGASM